MHDAWGRDARRRGVAARGSTKENGLPLRWGQPVDFMARLGGFEPTAVCLED